MTATTSAGQPGRLGQPTPAPPSGDRPAASAKRTALLSASSAMGFVLLMGLVSLFADMTYEGGRSLSGQYLRLLGSSAVWVGIAAGAGEFVGYGLRFISGYVADRTGRYWVVAIVGYVINLLAIPFLAFTGAWPMAVGLLFAERIGKGIRNPSRDALLSYATKEMGRGWGYGVHEAMDSIGGFLGPTLMAGVLFWRGNAEDIPSYQLGFKILAIPAVLSLIALAVAVALFPNPTHLESKTPKASAQGLTRKYWLYVTAAGLIGAGFADFALMAYHLKAHNIVPDDAIPLFYSGAGLVGIVVALLGGKLYDRFGFSTLIGAMLIAAFFAPFVFLGSLPLVVFGFLLWAIGTAAQSSLVRAALADMVPRERRAYGFGLFATIFGVFWFAGSAVMGALYDRSELALVIFSVVVQLAAIPLFFAARRAPDPATA